MVDVEVISLAAPLTSMASLLKLSGLNSTPVISG
jgi:hypothetical protein